jgi:hypothetical protein
MHADKTNRSALTLLGLVLLAAGAGAMALSVGLFGAGRARKPLFANTVSKYVGAHGSWIWVTAAVLAALVALIMLRWLAALLLSTDRAGDLEIRNDGSAEPRGTGVVKSAAVNKAVVAEIQTYRGVESAKSRTLGDADEPRLALSITVDKADNLDSVRKRVEADAVAHVRQALDHPTLPVLLDFTIAAKPPARV